MSTCLPDRDICLKQPSKKEPLAWNPDYIYLRTEVPCTSETTLLFSKSRCGETGKLSMQQMFYFDAIKSLMSIQYSQLKAKYMYNCLIIIDICLLIAGKSW